jgi:acyl carrier protein
VLKGKPTAVQIEAIVHKTIAELLERRGRQAVAINNDSLLVAIGLISLDLAALIATLQTRLKADPFFSAKSITDVRTVGDLCRAYGDFIGEN